MKKYLLFIVFCFGVRVVCTAQSPVYRFEADSFFIPPEGGVLNCSLAFSERTEQGIIRLVPGEIELESWTASSRLTRSVANAGCAFRIEHDMIDTDHGKGFDIGLKLLIVETGEKVEINLHYMQDPFDYLHGGVIRGPDKRVCRKGEIPGRILSSRPAVGAVFSLDGSRTTYTWEKRSVSDGIWTPLPGQTGLDCQPERVENETVYYRRKASRGPHTAWSNTVEILTELDAGLIGLSVAADGEWFNILSKENPSVAWEFTRLEQSADLQTWSYLAAESNVSIDRYPLPDRTTYYRRAAFTSDGEEAYSNIVCCSPQGNAHISTHTARNGAGDMFEEDIAFYDGLGRLMRTVGVNASPSGRDLTTLVAYDDKGRQAWDYLPYPDEADSVLFSAGIEDLIGRQDRYYRSQNDTYEPAYPYVRREYDDSPLDRPLKVFRPGAEYRGETERFGRYGYRLNTGDDRVLHLSLSADGSLLCGSAGRAPATLRKTTFTDEDGSREETFTDLSDRTILVRQWISDAEHADTYSVYDALGRLRWVVSPEGSARLAPGGRWALTNENANKYCYRYLYDGDGNVAVRYIPGRAPDRMTYDAAGRVVTSRNGAQRLRNEMLRYHFDPLGRVTEVALLRADASDRPNPDPDPSDPFRPGLLDSVKFDPGVIGPLPDPDPVVVDPVPIDPPLVPTDPLDPPLLRPSPDDPAVVPLMASAPVGIGPAAEQVSRPLCRYFYDDYGDEAGFAGHGFAAVSGVTDPAGPSAQVRGLKTREMLYSVSGDSAGGGVVGRCVRRTFYYDARGRIIQRVESDLHDRLLRTSCSYDYRGNLLVREELHHLSAADSVRLRFRYDYDVRNRLLRERLSIDSIDYTDISYTYDELGRLQSMRTATGLCADYAYNLQGWITRIAYGKEQGLLFPEGATMSFPIFTQQFNYFTPSCSSARYSGDIAEIHWTRGENPAQGRLYGYAYDGLHRLTEASYYAFKPRRSDFTSPPYELTNRYTEGGLRYDRNGNLLGLTRHDGDSVLRFTFERDGNRLAAQTVARGANTAPDPLLFDADSISTRNRYDTLGRRIYDGAADLELCFDDNDRPQRIKPTATSSDLVNYHYLWNGEKRSATDASGNGYCYRGSARYLLADGTTTLESVPFAMGRIVRDGNAYAAHYFVTDHLGSVRTVLDADHRVLAEYDYHPYGSQHTNAELAASGNDYRLGGKEWQERFGVPYYDFGARLYDGIEWCSSDALSEKFRSIGPYVYCAGNPVNLIDPNGMDIYRFDEKSGTMNLFRRTDDDYDQVGIFKYDKKTDTYKLKTNKKGEANTKIDRVEKGILSDGMDFKTEANVWEVGGEGQPSVDGFQDFAIEFSEMIGREVSGFYFTRKGQDDVSYIHMGKYENNTWGESRATPGIYKVRPDLIGKLDNHTSWHTHPSSAAESDKLRGSEQDDIHKDEHKKLGIKNFIILTRGYPPIPY